MCVWWEKDKVRERGACCRTCRILRRQRHLLWALDETNDDLFCCGGGAFRNTEPEQMTLRGRREWRKRCSAEHVDSGSSGGRPSCGGSMRLASKARPGGPYPDGPLLTTTDMLSDEPLDEAAFNRYLLFFQWRNKSWRRGFFHNRIQMKLPTFSGNLSLFMGSFTDVSLSLRTSGGGATTHLKVIVTPLCNCTLTFHGIRSREKIVSLLVWTHLKGAGSKTTGGLLNYHDGRSFFDSNTMAILSRSFPLTRCSLVGGGNLFARRWERGWERHCVGMAGVGMCCFVKRESAGQKKLGLISHNS